jgi:hypothetical protein
MLLGNSTVSPSDNCFGIGGGKPRGQPLTEDRQSDRKMGNTLYWSHPWHDPFGLPMKVPSTMSPQEEMSGKRFFYPVQIMRSSSPIFGMPFTSMALSFMPSFSWQTLPPHRGGPEGESQPFHARPQ